MKIALCQLNFKVGDIEGNTLKILDLYQRAVSEEADLAVFSELAICGYSPEDLLDYPHFVKACEQALLNIAEIVEETAILIGCPTFSGLKFGKKLYNSAAFLHKGEIRKVFHKTLLPTYNIFNEYRYFEPNDQFQILEFKGHKIAVSICEDLWDIDETRYYKQSPMQKLIALEPDLMINLSGSPFSYEHIEERRDLMCRNALKYDLPLVYVNQIGANTDMIFDGGSMFIDRDGTIAEELEYFKEDFKIVNWQKGFKYSNHSHGYQNEDVELIYNAIVLGIRDYFQKSGFSKAILGLSGGLDSALVTVLAVRALGAENVLPVMLPSVYSSGHSITDSELLCKNLKIDVKRVEIQKIVDELENQLKPLFNDEVKGLTHENLQARTRGILLMAISNKLGHILLNTTNKSEAAVGYGTLYGDLCGGLSVIGDVYKTQAYRICRYINSQENVIPENILTKAPSAELRPDQKDTDSLPEYDVLDGILHAYIERFMSPDEIVELGYDGSLVNNVIKW